MVDGPTHTMSAIPLQLPSRTHANELVRHFELRVQPFSYVFDMEEFHRIFDLTYENPMGCPRHWLCLIHLVFALGSVYVPGGTIDSGKFFESGLGLCVSDCASLFVGGIVPSTNL